MVYSHPFKSILLHGMTDYVKLDVEIVDLIVALNKLGWHTEQSCQDNVDGRVWIQFRSATEAEWFLNLIAKHSIDLHEYVFNATTEGYDKSENSVKYKNRWWVDSFLSNIYWRKNIVDKLFIHISVRFPREHLEKVTSLVVKQANKET